MRGRAMMILASAVLAGSLLATGAQARGGGVAVAAAAAIWVALAEPMWELLAAATSTWALEDVASLAAATTALIARITGHTLGHTPALTEW